MSLTVRYCPQCQYRLDFAYSDPDDDTTAYDCKGCNRRFVCDRAAGTITYSQEADR